MKKLMVLIVLVAVAAGFAAAGSLDFHLGAGYHSSYVGNLPTDFGSGVDIVKAMPLGIGGYAGIGYGFGETKMVNIGVEFAPNWDFAINPPGISNFGFQGRAYLKLKPASIVTITGFGGFAGNTTGSFSNPGSFVGSPVLGARVSLLFLYAEYAAVIQDGFSGIAKHEIGLGFAFFK